MIVERYEFNYWGSKYPMYRCRTWNGYHEICRWMRKHSVEHFLWSSGSGGYIFDIRGDNSTLFILKWC